LGATAKRALVKHYRIDREHSNSYEAWKAMGSPANVSPEQYALLEKAAALKMVASPRYIDVKSAKAELNFALPRQGVSLVEVSW
jgi:xylan 1,4-beta-xylosidase